MQQSFLGTRNLGLNTEYKVVYSILVVEGGVS